MTIDNFSVPLLDLKAQFETIESEVRLAIDKVLNSQQFILGPEVLGLEKEIARYSGTKYACGVSSGTDALLISLMALDIGEGDEVITTPFSFFATVGVICRLGAKPVFVDIQEKSFNIDPTKLKNAITSRTKAIIPVHLFGRCAEMDPIMDIANEENIFVIEDAAQAIGAKYKESGAGSIGSLGCLSFFPSKNLGGFGDGGMVLTSDENLFNKLRVLRSQGANPKYYHPLVGGNFRLDSLQAAILRVKLLYLDSWIEARQRNALYYGKAFKSLGLPKDLFECPELGPYRNVLNQYVIRSSKRDKIIKTFKENSIGCEIYYPLPLHLQESLSELKYEHGAFPIAERAAEEVLAIPIYPEITRDQQDRVIKTIEVILKQ